MAMGGNFVAATPDTEVTEAALRSCALTVHVSTEAEPIAPRHRTHRADPAVAGPHRQGRTQPAGNKLVTVEDSMSVVHLSRGGLKPASDHLRSEVAIVCGLAQALFGPRASGAVGAVRRPTTTASATRISRVVPGFADFNARVRQPDGFVLPHPPRDERRFDTRQRRGQLHRQRVGLAAGAAGRLILQTMRSPTTSTTPRSTASTTATAESKAAGGSCSATLTTSAAAGFVDGDRVDLVSEWPRPTGRRGTAGRGLPAGAVSDAAGKCRCLLSGNQSADPAQSRCPHFEHPRLESRHDSSRAA